MEVNPCECIKVSLHIMTHIWGFGVVPGIAQIFQRNPSATTTMSTWRLEEINFSEQSGCQYAEKQLGSHSLAPNTIQNNSRVNPRCIYITSSRRVSRAKSHSSSLHMATEALKVQAWTFRLPLVFAPLLISFDSKKPPSSRAARAAWLICLSAVLSVSHSVKRVVRT